MILTSIEACRHTFRSMAAAVAPMFACNASHRASSAQLANSQCSMATFGAEVVVSASGLGAMGRAPQATLRNLAEATCLPPAIRPKCPSAFRTPKGVTTISSKPRGRSKRRKVSKAYLELAMLLGGAHWSGGAWFPGGGGQGSGGGGGGGNGRWQPDGHGNSDNDGYDGSGGETLWLKYYETTRFWHLLCFLCFGNTACFLIQRPPQPHVAN
jgi:hypothetical protein